MTERNSSFDLVVEHVVEMVQDYVYETGQDKRGKLRGRGLEKLRTSVETLIRDSIGQVYDPNYKGEAMIQRNSRWYSSAASPSQLSYRTHVKRAFQAMQDLGLLETTTKGFYGNSGGKSGSGQSKVTRYRATDALVEMFGPNQRDVLPVIVPRETVEVPIRVNIKSREAEDEKFPAAETGDVLLMADNLRRINRTLARSWYDLEIPDSELAKLQVRMAKHPDGPKSLGLHRRQLHRTFNDHELSTGGRFYGGWWQNIPSSYRRLVTVNGKRMVEVDYATVQPTILYAQEGVAPPEDCYRGVFDQATESSGGDDLREDVKTALNAMLNALQPMKQAPRDVNPRRWNMSWRDFSSAIRAAHPAIGHHFFSGVGKKLQRA